MYTRIVSNESSSYDAKLSNIPTATTECFEIPFFFKRIITALPEFILLNRFRLYSSIDLQYIGSVVDHKAPFSFHPIYVLLGSYLQSVFKERAKLSDTAVHPTFFPDESTNLGKSC